MANEYIEVTFKVRTDIPSAQVGRKGNRQLALAVQRAKELLQPIQHTYDENEEIPIAERLAINTNISFDISMFNYFSEPDAAEARVAANRTDLAAKKSRDTATMIVLSRMLHEVIEGRLKSPCHVVGAKNDRTFMDLTVADDGRPVIPSDTPVPMDFTITGSNQHVVRATLVADHEKRCLTMVFEEADESWEPPQAVSPQEKHDAIQLLLGRMLEEIMESPLKPHWLIKGVGKDGKVFVDLNRAANSSIMRDRRAANQYEYPSLPITFTVSGSCGNTMRATIEEDPKMNILSVRWERKGEGQ